MNRLSVLAALFAATAAQAQTTWVPIPVDPAASGVATKAACNAALRAKPGTSATCVERIKVPAATAPTPAPAPAPTPAPAPAPAPSPAPSPAPAPAPSPAPAPAPAPSPAPAPAPAPAPGANALYFSPTGLSTNPGTLSAPKRDLAGVNVNALPAGSQLLFQRGGTWNWSQINIENLNATPTNPLVIADYGTGALPVLRTTSGNAIEFGGPWGNTTNDGGYVVRNIKLDGSGSSSWGVWLKQNVRNVTLDGVEITGFNIAVNSSNGTPWGVTNFTLRNSLIVRNSDMGLLGSMSGALIEGNTFDGNNFSGSSFSHAIYLSGGDNNTVRGNTLRRNSTVNGVCNGGNLTAHGQITNLLIEGNTIEQDSATGGCYGISLTPGYTSPEWFRNTVVRGNTVINVGYVGIGAGAAPGIVIENNRVINTLGTYQTGIQIPTGIENDLSLPLSAGDDRDGNAVVRNNSVCFANPSANSRPVSVSGPGSTVTGTVYTTANCR